MNIAYPFQFGPLGRTLESSDLDHVEQMIEQLLFTDPKERVNRPDFGSGMRQLVFSPNSPELAAALQFALQAALQRWLGDLIQLQGLSVTCEDSSLFVAVDYALVGDTQTRTAQLARTV
jgi:phage baseplate assembly protein W